MDSPSQPLLTNNNQPNNTVIREIVYVKDSQTQKVAQNVNNYLQVKIIAAILSIIISVVVFVIILESQ